MLDDRPSGGLPQLVLLRHGATASHRGDVPLSHEGRQQSDRAGHRIARMGLGRLDVLTSPTQRTQQTGLLLVHGMTSAEPATKVAGPSVASTLRNPDLYLAGQRVDMVSSAAAFCEQAPGLAEADLAALPFYARFLTAPDRIGWWLHHPAPPGDDASAVTARLLAFAASLGDVGGRRPDTVLCVTHSPVLRAVALRLLGTDPGEPRHLSGYILRHDAAGTLHAEKFDPSG